MDVNVCPYCSGTRLHVDAVAGKKYCLECGIVLGEMVLTEEVGFGETSSGAVVAEGTRLSAGALGVSFGKQGRYGGTSQELTETAGKRKCQDLAMAMQMGYGLGEEAARVWYLAYHARFTRGRRGDLVAAACLYLACRQRSTPQPYMLIDFSSRLNNVNVFELGAVYLKLLKAVPIKDPKPLDPAIYIHRFAGYLEFGEDEDKVKMDAANLVKGFRRDWMIEGRRPSGICGAALILAARMNNYRRSVAEVVQVVKIADTTLKKRLEEFQQTPAGQMSISEVRQRWELDKQGIEAFPSASAPPIFNKHRRIEALQAEQSARAARRASSEATSSAGDTSDGHDEESDDDDETRSRRKKRKLNPKKDVQKVKRDREASFAPSSRGGTPRAGSPALQRNSEAGPGPTTQANALAEREQEAQDDAEDDDEEDDNDVLNSAVADQVVGEVLNEALAEEDVAEALMKIEHTKEEELSHIQDDIARRPEDDPLKGLDEDELDDYICDPIEAKIKMHTWIDTNMDYLVKLQAKLRKNKLDELRDEAEAEQKKPRMRRGPVGPAESAAEATKGLIERRQYSRNVNYKAIDSLFESNPDDEEDSRAGTPLHGVDEKMDEKGEDDNEHGDEKGEDHGNDKADDYDEEEEEPSYRQQSHVDHEQWD